MRLPSTLLLAAALGACSADHDPRAVEGDDPEECRDRADNDADGAFDCDDSGCVGSPDCDGPADDDDGADDDDAAPEPDPDRILDDIEYLASDALRGRFPGTPGGDLAVDYIADRFASLELEPAGDPGSFLRGFPLAMWEVTAEPSLVVDGRALAPGTGFRLFRNSGSAELQGVPLVFAGYGLTVPPFDPADYPDCPLDPAGFDEYAGLDVDGAVVLVLRHGPDDRESVFTGCPSSGDPLSMQPPGAVETLWLFSYKVANAQAHGAAALLLVQDYRHGDEERLDAGLRGESFQADFGAAVVERPRLEELLPALPDWAAEIDAADAPASRDTGLRVDLSFAAEQVELVAEDIVGAVPGTDRADEVVLIGAHMDGLGVDEASGLVMNGADDNASGTAVTMELARLLAARATPPSRTVVFAAFNAEEQGLVGSCDYAYSSSVPYPTTNVVAMASVDMVGGGHGSGLELVGGAEAPGDALFELMLAEADRAGLPWTVAAREARFASDHACFAEQGVPAVLMTTEGEHPEYHLDSDEFSAIRRDDVEAAVGLLWPWLQALADGAGPG